MSEQPWPQLVKQLEQLKKSIKKASTDEAALLEQIKTAETLQDKSIVDKMKSSGGKARDTAVMGRDLQQAHIAIQQSRETIITEHEYFLGKLNQALDEQSNIRFSMEKDIQENERLQNEIAALQKELAQQTRLADKFKSDYATLFETLKSVEDQSTQANIRLDEQKREFETLNEEYERVDELYQKMVNEREEREAKFRRQLKNAERTHKAKLESIESLKEHISIAQNAITDLQENQIANLEYDIERKTDEYTALLRISPIRLEQIDSLQKQLDQPLPQRKK